MPFILHVSTDTMHHSQRAHLIKSVKRGVSGWHRAEPTMGEPSIPERRLQVIVRYPRQFGELLEFFRRRLCLENPDDGRESISSVIMHALGHRVRPQSKFHPCQGLSQCHQRTSLHGSQTNGRNGHSITGKQLTFGRFPLKEGSADR